MTSSQALTLAGVPESLHSEASDVKLFVVGVVWYYRADMPVWAMAVAVVWYAATIVNNANVIRRQ